MYVVDKFTFKFLVEVHLWFSIQVVDYYFKPLAKSVATNVSASEKEEVLQQQLAQNLNVIVSGDFSNLVILEFDQSCIWKLKSTLQFEIQSLMAEYLDYNQSIGISEWSSGILRGLKAIGIPAPA